VTLGGQVMLDVQLDKAYEGSRLCIEFRDGEVAEVEILDVALPNKYDTTPESWGMVYNLILTNRQRNARKGAAFWSQLSTIKSFEGLEDAS